MSEPSPPEHQTDHLPGSYERMLTRLRERFVASEDGGPRLSQALEEVKRAMVADGELTRAEADRVGDALQRDLEEAGAWLADRSHDHPLRDWLRMDLQMLESWLWDAFSSAADRTSMELRGFVTTGEPSLYHTDEIAGPGELACIACGRTITLQRPGHIPPCPGCDHTEFVRTAHREGSG